MTVYVNGVPILSRESYQEEKNCDICGNALAKGPLTRIIHERQEPYRELEICGSCATAKTEFKEKENEKNVKEVVYMKLKREELMENKEHENCWSCGTQIQVGDIRQVIQQDSKSLYYCQSCDEKYKEHLEAIEHLSKEIPDGFEKVKVKKVKLRYDGISYSLGSELIVKTEHFDGKLMERID